jgi:hypothetical protein
MAPNSCPTVAIQGEPSEGNPSGIVVINESDFDEATMTLCAIPEPTVETAPETAPQGDLQEPAKVVAPWAAKKEAK